MSLPAVLTTKLFFPPARQNLVPRPRLLEKVTRGLQSRLILISAPAGYGKTTLLAEWRSGSGSGMPVAWLSLDNDDNDVTRFLIYLATALGTLTPGIGETALINLQSPQPPTTQVILTALINDLTSALTVPSALVLDDYHVINSQPVHEAITYLLDHLPQQMHIILLTRADPSLPLTRLRARGQLTEIRAADLRFSVEEATAFLNRVMGLDLTGVQVAELEERTEGWIAGLQLAALSMQGQDDVQGFISALSGSHRYIVDYLVEEVLNRQSDAVREFVLRTSILERLTAPLCNVLTGREDGQETLESLERANLFIIPLDDERRWYRYHHLFAEMLRNQLNLKYPITVPQLHRLAADWCESHQWLEQAIEHTFAVKDYDQVIHIIRKYYFQLMIPTNIGLIWHWIRSFPEEVLRDNPWLGTYYAWFLWNRGNRQAAESYVNSAQVAWDRKVSLGQMPGDDTWLSALPAEILSLQGVISASKGELKRTVELANQALAISPETAYTVRGIVYLNLYVVYRDQGQIEKAIESCTEALPLAIKGGEKGLIVDAFHHLALMHIIRGQLKQAEQVYQEGLNYAETNWQPDFPTCGLLLIHLAEIHYEWGDIEKALCLAERAIGLSEIADWWTSIYGRAFLARLHLSMGKLPAALNRFQEADTLVQQFQGAYFESEMVAYLARIKAELGKLDEAEEWMRSQNLRIADRLSFPQHILAFSMAYIMLALDRNEDLIALMSTIESLATTQGCVYWQVKALALMAVAWQKMADLSRAVLCLEKALDLAEGERYIRVFLDAGMDMIILLKYIATKGMHLEYVRTLLSAAYQAEKITPSIQLLVESLSKRELEVLRLVGAGKSNKEIADTLFIATGTVKKHLNNIFGKLGVRSRTQCLAQARKLNLL